MECHWALNIELLNYRVMKHIILLTGFLIIALTQSHQSDAQFFDKLVDHVADRVEDKIINDAGDAAVKSVDKTEDAIGDAATNSGKATKKSEKKSAASKEKSNAKNKNTAAIPTGNTAGNNEDPAARQGMGNVNTGYDFKPGERTIFETDFSDAVVGNFPRNLTFHGGNMSVVSYEGGRALRVNTVSKFIIKLPEKLPERFTLKFDEFNSSFVNDMSVKFMDAEGKAVGSHFIQVSGGGYGVGVASYKRDGISALQKSDVINQQMTTIRVMADGAYVKVYVGKKRVANMPNANLGRSNTLLFDFSDVREKPIYIANIRIAAGGRDLYSTLEAEGRVAINDIHFATGKAEILPESYKFIEKIEKLLKSHPDLKLLIEGHTDNVGEFDANMKLSKERAAAVKSYLVEKSGIAADRLETMGQGEAHPVADNDTEEGRAENRRVEIVKL